MRSLTRTQYKIEGCLSRACLAADYLLLSSSADKTAGQPPLDFKAYIYEPPKQVFVDPVAVLDFQSLYPSIMIANNICYSTCLGLLGHSVFERDGLFSRKLGFARNNLSLTGWRRDDLHISFNGCVFVRRHVRRGLIPQLLEEFLRTRILLKRSAKMHSQARVSRRHQSRCSRASRRP